MKMSEEIQEMINENYVHLATISNDGKPNVVPVGAIRAINDSELLIADVMFNKTKKNLLENCQVAIAVESLGKETPSAYQLKGQARIFTNGEIFDKAEEMIEELRKRNSRHAGIKLKSAVLVEVEEIYSTVRHKKGDNK